MDINALLKQEIQSYDRKSWTGLIGGEEVTIYADPLSPADEKQITRKFPNFMQSPGTAGMAYAIALKARKDDGERMFSMGKDLPILNKFKMGLIAEIFAGLFGEEVEPDFDGTVKNSKTTSTD